MAIDVKIELNVTLRYPIYKKICYKNLVLSAYHKKKRDDPSS